MPASRGVSLRGTGSLKPYRSWLRDGHNLKPPAGGVKAVTTSLSPSGNGLRLRGAAVVQPNQRSSDHPMARNSPAKAVMRRRVEAAMREVHENTPSTVERADVSGERKESMLRAIAYSKARRGK